MFLSEVAHKLFCVKSSGVISKLKILEKSYWSPHIFNVHTYIWSLFKAKKKLWGANEAFRIILLQRHKKFRCDIIFLGHAIKNSSRQMRQISRRMEMIHPTIGWRRDEHGTHKHAHGSWILWSVSRVRSKTMHSLSCITSWLPYITLCYIDSRFFLPLEQSRTALFGCRLAVSELRKAAHWQLRVCVYYTSRMKLICLKSFLVLIESQSYTLKVNILASLHVHCNNRTSNTFFTTIQLLQK